MEKRWYKAREPSQLRAPSFDSLASEYQRLWDSMIVKVEKGPLINADVTRVSAHRGAYVTVGIVPWAVVGILDQMEAGGGANRHLHNGDPLDHRTIHVPAGRLPPPAQPPFTWLQSALDALRLEGLDQVVRWDIPRLCYELEKYNGFGYRQHGIFSPYLWSYSNHYTVGKYVADGRFDPRAVSQQVGAMPLLKYLLTANPSADFLHPVPTPQPVPTPAPAPTPGPAPQPSPQPVPQPAPGPSIIQSIIDAILRAFGR